MASSSLEVMAKRENRSPSKGSESTFSVTTLNSRSTLLRGRTARYSGMITGLKRNSEVTQRVQSARMSRIKNLQNQLSEALQYITTLTNENRLLKTIHKRQDSALAKYEGSTAELPRILNSHAEELRICRVKCRELSLKNHELAKQIKQKDENIVELQDTNRHLLSLDKDKNLEQRETLSGKVHYLELRLAEKDEEIKILTRKNMLETKNYKTQLINEQKKCKEFQKQLEKFNSSSTIDSGYDTVKRNSAERIQMVFKKPNSFLPRPLKKSATKILLHTHDSVEDIENCDGKSMEKASNHFEQDDDVCENCNGNPEMPNLTALNNNHDDDDDLIMNALSNRSTEKNLPIVHRFSNMKIGMDDIGDGISSPKEDLIQIQNEISNDIEEKEKLLDSYCDIVTKEVDNINNTKTNFNTKITSTKVFNLHKTELPKPMKRAPLDPLKKTKLLAALKSIETNSFGN